MATSKTQRAVLTNATRTYTWDARNRLAAISGPVNASFQYDAFGRRIRKTVAGTSTNYLYDGLNPVQELNGTTPTANLLTGMNLDEFFRRTDNTGTRDFLTDTLGTVLALADNAGSIQTSYTYEPFGNTTMSGTTSGNSYQYTGRENDGTGVYYYRARYYNPTLQRFISWDPIWLVGGLNTYSYVEGNPLSFWDELGLAGSNRGVGGSSGRGTTNPYKHCKQHPTDPNKIICEEKGTGKKKTKPKPHDWDDYKSKSEMCGETCQNIVGGVLIAGAVVAGYCIAGPIGGAAVAVGVGATQ